MADTNRKQPLSPAEWEIMKLLWEHGDQSLGEVVEKLGDKQGWAYNTVKTFMRRMVDKGWVSARKVGKAHLYSAKVVKKRAVGQAVKEFSRRVLDGVLTPVVAYYAEDHDLSDGELDELEQIIRKARRKKGGR